MGSRTTLRRRKLRRHKKQQAQYGMITITNGQNFGGITFYRLGQRMYAEQELMDQALRQQQYQMQMAQYGNYGGLGHYDNIGAGGLQLQ